MIGKIAPVTKPLLHKESSERLTAKARIAALGLIGGASAVTDTWPADLWERLGREREHGVALTQPSRPNQPLHDIRGDAIFAPRARILRLGP